MSASARLGACDGGWQSLTENMVPYRCSDCEIDSPKMKYTVVVYGQVAVDERGRCAELPVSQLRWHSDVDGRVGGCLGCILGKVRMHRALFHCSS